MLNVGLTAQWVSHIKCISHQEINYVYNDYGKLKLPQHNNMRCVNRLYSRNDCSYLSPVSYTLSVVWRWVASISTGWVPFSIFRGPLAMLFSGWVLMSVCHEDQFTGWVPSGTCWLLCYFASWRVPPVFILATHRNTSEGVHSNIVKTWTNGIP